MPVDRLTATDCNAAARAKKENIESKRISEAEKSLIDKLEVKNQEIRDLHSEREDLQYKYDEHIKNLQARIQGSEIIVKKLNKEVIENESNVKSKVTEMKKVF